MPALIHHALVLNFHQPSGNLDELLAKPNPEGEDGWEGKEILYAMDRMPRMLWEHESIARVHLALSGSLLETLSNADFQARTHGIVQCGKLLWHLQNQKIFEVLGSAYYHPVLPLIPEADWDEQLKRWLGIGQHLFWRSYIPGFWPPEMAFCMELIPVLKRHGYDYVLVDSENIEAIDPMPWHDLRYRPHIAEYGGEQITIVVRDRSLSDAQESGMEYDWFRREVIERTQHCDYVPLVTTCTDGDNGGWFRNFRDRANFWSAFYNDLLDRVGMESPDIRPTFIADHLRDHPPVGRVKVKTAAWNTGWHDGKGFVQWTGSDAQKAALARVSETSGRLHALIDQARREDREIPALGEAQWRLLRAETSCNFFWGEAWVERCHRDLDEAWPYIHLAEESLKS